MGGSGALEHLGRWVERVFTRGEPTPLLTVRSGRGLLNSSHLHRVIEEPPITGAAGTLARLNDGRRTHAVKRRRFAANLGVGIRELFLLRVPLLALLGISLLGRGERPRLSVNVLLGRVGSLLRVRRALLRI